MSHEDPLCAAVSSLGKAPVYNPLLLNPNDQCVYQVEYADLGLSMGVLVKDTVPTRLTNGKVINPNLGFGCVYTISVCFDITNSALLLMRCLIMNWFLVFCCVRTMV